MLWALTADPKMGTPGRTGRGAFSGQYLRWRWDRSLESTAGLTSHGLVMACGHPFRPQISVKLRANVFRRASPAPTPSHPSCWNWAIRSFVDAGTF